MQLLVYPVTVFVWFTRSVNHAMSWSKILIPGWPCHSEQSACHMVYYCQRQVPVYAQLSYLSFTASESDHFAMVAVTHVFFIVFHSSLLLRFHMPAFLQLACLLSVDYNMELCSHGPTFHGLDLQCRSCHLETQESLLILICVVTFHVSHLPEHFFILNFCLYHMLSKKIT